jgi:hypothetical protein
MSGTTLTPEEQAEQEDRNLLRQHNQDIQEVMQLLIDGNTRAVAKKKTQEANDRLTVKGKGGMVFHPYRGKRVPVTQEASNYLALGEAMELALTTSQFNADLQRALATLARKKASVLERLLKRKGV